MTTAQMLELLAIVLDQRDKAEMSNVNLLAERVDSHHCWSITKAAMQNEINVYKTSRRHLEMVNTDLTTKVAERAASAAEWHIAYIDIERDRRRVVVKLAEVQADLRESTEAYNCEFDRAERLLKERNDGWDTIAELEVELAEVKAQLKAAGEVIVERTNALLSTKTNARAILGLVDRATVHGKDCRSTG